MPYFLGIDGGQSSTTAVIGDENGRVAGMGNAGPCNHVTGPEGRAKFFHAVGDSVAEACRQAGISAGIEFECVAAGFSGGPEDKQDYLRELVKARKYLVTIDAPIALAGATGGEPGIITVAGTGSISYGANAAGKTARAGGWGYIYGDEGGGFDIARQAVRAILRHEEGWGPPTLLTELLIQETGSRSANDLMHRLYANAYSRPQIARFAKIVDAAAMQGDALAKSLLTNAAQQLATFTSAVRAQIFQSGETVSVAHIGNVYRSQILLERFRTLVELEDGNKVIAPMYGPAAGALLCAYRDAGMRPQLTNYKGTEK